MDTANRIHLVRPFLPDGRDVEFDCRRVRVRPQGLKGGADVEFREPGDIGLINQLQVCDVVPVARDAVRFTRCLETIQREFQIDLPLIDLSGLDATEAQEQMEAFAPHV